MGLSSAPRILLLDTNIVSVICNPKARGCGDLVAWYRQLLLLGADAPRLFLPEIVDYETRRGLLHLAKKNKCQTTPRLKRLDQLCSELHYLPLNTEMMRDAAHLWAAVRVAGRPTAPERALDGDVILAAQARWVGGTVITHDKHFSQIPGVESCSWQDLEPQSYLQ